MSTGWIVLIVVLVILVALIIGLYFLGKRAEKKQEEQNAQVEATAQNVTMLIIDKKKLRIKDSGLPEQVIAQTPFYAKLSKLPIVKAKVGPKVMSLICDATIFDEIPVKKEVKASVSGIYITGVRGLRGPIEKPAKKKGFRARMQDRYNKANAELQAEKERTEKEKAAKAAKKKNK